MKKSIAFLINSLEFGGAQRVFIDDANAFLREGYKVTFFVLYEGKTEDALASELDAGVELVHLAARSAFDGKALRRCAYYVKQNSIGTLITTLNDGNRSGQWVALMVPHLRLIEREANTLSTKTFLQKMLDVVFFWVPYKVIAVSSEIQKSLIRLRPFSRKKILLLPNAVTLPPLRDTFAERAGVAAPVRILSVGRLTEQKNYALLIEALGTLHQEGLDFLLTIVGEGVLRESLEERIQRAGLKERVSLLGHLSHAAVLEQYAQADIFVSTSRWEGSPNVVLEALSYGLPVVATAVGGVPDVVTDGVEGVLVPSEDTAALAKALKSLIKDPALRKKLGTAARRHVERDFSREARFARLRGIVEAA